MIVVRVEAEDGTLLTVTTLTPKQFKTGSKGFYGQGQIVVDGKRYQLNLQAVEIGSRKKKIE